ncbi:MAG TPA: YfiR family protein [Bacteroidales bacterium]|nr:YfiR family protein [Bacteroidales bacterium]
MKKKRALITMLFVMFWCCLSAEAQNEKFKALFLYNFIKNIEWPQAYTQGDLNIAVLGNGSIVKELETITGTQKAGNQSMKVTAYSSVDEIKSCHLVYVCPNKTGLLPQLKTRLNGSSTLIVSDSKGGIQQGACINFILDGDKLKFEISKQHIDQKSLKVSASLLNLGINVN